MGYLAVWKVLDEMITDFRRKGIAVPPDVVGDLRYARTLINVLKAEPSNLETGQKVEECLRNVESLLTSIGIEKLGNQYVDEWLKRIDEASRSVFDDEGQEVRFILGVPREKRWIRVKPSGDMPVETLRAFAGELNLSVNVQEDGCLLVYGEGELVKAFVKKIATKYGLKTGK